MTTRSRGTPSGAAAAFSRSICTTRNPGALTLALFDKRPSDVSIRPRIQFRRCRARRYEVRPAIWRRLVATGAWLWKVERVRALDSAHDEFGGSSVQAAELGPAELVDSA